MSGFAFSRGLKSGGAIVLQRRRRHRVIQVGIQEEGGKDMAQLRKLTALAFGAVLVAACGAERDESAAQTAPAPDVEMQATTPDDTLSPADSTDTMPPDEPDPAMSDTLPTAEDPPPAEPSPPPSR
jgi:hypothetical protein